MNWADREYAIGRGVAAIRHRTRPELQPFVRAVVEYGLPGLLAQATGSTFPNVSADQLAGLWWPPLEENEQRAIAHILGTLVDKIELNRRMNETLEAMARALFKSWFVDFDPVRAKVAGRDPGLPKPIADLFPDSFEDSELGEIPKGWAVEPLSNITTVITKGTTPTQAETGTDDDADDAINYVRVNAIDESGAVLFDKLTTIHESVHLGALKRSVLQAGDVLYTIAGTIGRTAIVDESLLPANTNQAVAIVRPKKAIPAAFLLMTMQADAFREELHSNIVHAVQANLSLGVLSRARAVVPPEDSLQQLFRPIADLTRRVASIRDQSRTLVALRDALLPKLISGQIRVRGV
jgi:type I restriction enzyme S subunit